MSDLVVLDAPHFDHMTGGDVALQIEIIGLFRAQVTDWSGMISPESPDEIWRTAAHTMKGSARGIGLWVLAEACENAENAAVGADVSAMLANVHAALGQALAALDAFARDHTPR